MKNAFVKSPICTLSKSMLAMGVLLGLLTTANVRPVNAQDPNVSASFSEDQQGIMDFGFGMNRARDPNRNSSSQMDGGMDDYGMDEMGMDMGMMGMDMGGGMGMGGGMEGMGMEAQDSFSKSPLVPEEFGGTNPFQRGRNRMARQQVIEQLEIYLKREQAHLASLEKAIETTTQEYRAASDANSKSRMLRYLRVDVDAVFESKLKVQEAELYLLLGKVLAIRDEHVSQAGNRDDLIARRIANLVSGKTDAGNSPGSAPIIPAEDLSKLKANEASHPEFADNKVRDAYRTNSLKRIGLALHNFEAAHRKFPGHANLRAGFPKRYNNASVVIQPFSWRVAILPYIKEQELYSHYRFDEAWDSEHNRQLIEKMPAFFRSPYALKSQPTGHANVQGFATKSGVMESPNGIGFASITDGTSNTILAVETAEAIPWTKPADLTTTQVKHFDNQSLLVLFADAAVREISLPVDQEKLDKLITRNGGEVVPQR